VKKRFSIYVILAIAFGIVAACSSSEQPTNTLTKPSDYPPLSSSIAEAPFGMIDGSISKISDRKGKVVLINLWATWCGFCLQEMPHLVAMQNELGPKGFTVLGLDIGDQNTGAPESVEQINAFAAKMNLNYELARIDGALTARLQKIAQANAVPTSFLIDREGRLRGRFVGGSVKVVEQMKELTTRVVNEPVE
jgi:thiol-disulfide isomerase/thioredoxin